MLRRPLLGVGVVDELLKRGRPLCWNLEGPVLKV